MKKSFHSQKQCKLQQTMYKMYCYILLSNLIFITTIMNGNADVDSLTQLFDKCCADGKKGSVEFEEEDCNSILESQFSSNQKSMKILGNSDKVM